LPQAESDFGDQHRDSKRQSGGEGPGCSESGCARVRTHRAKALAACGSLSPSLSPSPFPSLALSRAHELRLSSLSPLSIPSLTNEKESIYWKVRAEEKKGRREEGAWAIRRGGRVGEKEREKEPLKRGGERGEEEQAFAIGFKMYNRNPLKVKETRAHK
jgi:hypothetical protein